MYYENYKDFPELDIMNVDEFGSIDVSTTYKFTDFISANIRLTAYPEKSTYFALSYSLKFNIYTVLNSFSEIQYKELNEISFESAFAESVKLIENWIKKYSVSDSKSVNGHNINVFAFYDPDNSLQIYAHIAGPILNTAFYTQEGNCANRVRRYNYRFINNYFLRNAKFYPVAIQGAKDFPRAGKTVKNNNNEGIQLSLF